MTAIATAAFRIDATTRTKVGHRWVNTTTTLVDGIANAAEANRIRVRFAALHPAALVACVGYSVRA